MDIDAIARKAWESRPLNRHPWDHADPADKQWFLADVKAILDAAGVPAMEARCAAMRDVLEIIASTFREECNTVGERVWLMQAEKALSPRHLTISAQRTERIWRR